MGSEMCIRDRYKVKSLPTLAIFQNGEIVWRESGLKTRAQLIKITNHFLEKSTASKEDNTDSTKKSGSWFSRLFKGK